jgi:hypothetical protein
MDEFCGYKIWKEILLYEIIKYDFPLQYFVKICESSAKFRVRPIQGNMTKIEMPEYRNAGEKVSPASLVLPTVRGVSPASVFRHQRQSGPAGHGLFR